MTRKEARKEVLKAIKRFPKRHIPGTQDAGAFESLTANLGRLVGSNESGDYAFLAPKNKGRA